MSKRTLDSKFIVYITISYGSSCRSIVLPTLPFRRSLFGEGERPLD